MLSLAIPLGAARYGGVEPRVAFILALAAIAAALLAWPRRRVSNAPVAAGEAKSGAFNLPILPLALVGGALLVALQLLPLPPAFIRFISPNTAAVFDETLAPIGLWPAWRPFSLAPGATDEALVVAAGVAAAAVAASLLGEDRRRRDALLKAIALSGLAIAVASMLSPLAGVGSLFESRLTFINRNHLAGFLQLATWPSFGFALRARGRSRLWWLLAFVFTSTEIFLTLSRGGIAAFFGAAAVSSALAFSHGHTPIPASGSSAGSGKVRPGESRLTIARVGVSIPPWLPRLALPVGFASTLAVVAWLALEPVLARLATIERAASEVKPWLSVSSAGLIGRFPVTGIGRGAFTTLYPSLKTESWRVTFTHIENTWLQLLVDMGPVIGIALLGVFAWAWIAAARQKDLSRPMIGALAGAAGVAAQNLVDFSFELLGVALPFAIVMGLASSAMPRFRIGRAPGLTLLGCLTVLAVTGTVLHARAPDDDIGGRVAAAVTTSEATAIARDALVWRPVDWVPPAAVGVRLVAAGKCSEGLPWLIRAMKRNPTAPEPHRYAARCLAAGGKSSLAKQEFRLAFLYGDGDALREAFARYPAPGDLIEIAPQTPEGLRAAAELLADRPEEARAVWQRAWESFLDPEALAGLARASLLLGDDAHALRHARELEERKPQVATGWILAASALDAAGDPSAARSELEAGLARNPNDDHLLANLGQRLILERRPSQARALFEKMAGRDDASLARKKVLIAWSLAAQGRVHEALTIAQDAASTDRASRSALESVAAYAADAGRLDLAVDALERAERLPGTKPGQYDKRLSELRAAALERQLKGK
jgi:tetratricopeptide (TPR) repeat protein